VQKGQLLVIAVGGIVVRGIAVGEIASLGECEQQRD